MRAKNNVKLAIIIIYNYLKNTVALAESFNFQINIHLSLNTYSIVFKSCCLFNKWIFFCCYLKCIFLSFQYPNLKFLNCLLFNNLHLYDWKTYFVRVKGKYYLNILVILYWFHSLLNMQTISLCAVYYKL